MNYICVRTQTNFVGNTGLVSKKSYIFIYDFFIRQNRHKSDYLHNKLSQNFQTCIFWSSALILTFFQNTEFCLNFWEIIDCAAVMEVHLVSLEIKSASQFQILNWLISFQFALMPFEKAWIHIFPELYVKSGGILNFLSC